MATMLFELIEHDGNPIMVLVHKSDNPTASEWEDYLNKWDSVEDLDNLRVLVITAGGAPDSSQRDALNRRAKDHTVKTAVISDALMPRMALRALSWVLGISILGFAPSNLDGAREHLDLNAEQWAKAENVARSLETELGVSLLTQ